MVAMCNHREDGDHQRLGIDRSITLENSKQILIDEKVRSVDYGDILLEHLSDRERGVLGWVEKQLLCDFIAYAVLPSKKCYLLPVVQLQTAWDKNKLEWIHLYSNKVAKNQTSGRCWETVSTPVPVSVVFREIGQALRIDFDATT